MRGTPNLNLVDDMAVFGRALIDSQDIDPLYPVLRHWERSMTEYEALIFTSLYLAYYNLPSAILAWEALDIRSRGMSAFTLSPQVFDSFPCATERRNLRGGKISRHLQDFAGRVSAAGSPQAFLKTGWTDDRNRNYLLFWETAQTVWNNGRWAAFKWAELLKKVHGWNLAAPDMRMEFCSGPKIGLELVFDHPGASVPQLNHYGIILRGLLAERGLQIADWEELETILCNFHSLYEGRYYVGNDIDELQHVIEHSTLSSPLKQRLYETRAAVFDHRYLGEKRGWAGISKSQRGLYKQKGIIAAVRDA